MTAKINYFNNLPEMEDCVPIGILIQTELKPHSRYKVLGLGYVQQRDGTHFIIEGVNSCG